MAEPDFTDAEKIALRKLIAQGGVWSNVQTFIETNPKMMIFVGVLVSGLVSWFTHGAVVVPPPQAVPVVVDKQGDVNKFDPATLTDEQKKALADQAEKLKSLK